ncbi:MAG: hypothetical protein ACK50J_08010, partial [Planctomyces sp.]
GSVTSSGSSNSFAIPVTLGSSGGFSHTGNGTFTVSSAIENNGYTLNLSATSGITLLSGIISGTGNITTGGSGTTALAAANTYSGTTTVTGGTLAVRHSQALGAATGVAATGTVVTSQSATVQLENGVSVGNELLSSTAETFGWDLRSTGANLTNSWDGNITSASNFEIRPTTNNRLNLNGTVSTASSSLYKFDSGVVAFNGALSNASQLYVGAGTVEANASLTTSSSPYVESGATLAGTGTFSWSNTGTAAVYGTISPGSGTSTGILNTDEIAFQSNANLTVQINGTTAGTQYDQLNVTGTVAVGGNLNVSVENGFTPAIGDVFTILTNDGTDPISG